MKSRYFAIFVLAVAFFASCGETKNEKKEKKVEGIPVVSTDSIVEEEVVPEEPSQLVKGLEIIDKDGNKSIVSFEYDEYDRLVRTTTRRNVGTADGLEKVCNITYRDGTVICEDATHKLTITLDSDSCAKKEEMISEGENFVMRYKYKSGKLSEYINEADCGSQYFWDGGNIAKVFEHSCDESFSYDTVIYKYSDIVMPNINILSFVGEGGSIPTAESVAPKGIVSHFMPSESTANVYNDAGIVMGTTISKYDYTTDEYNRITNIAYSIQFGYDGNFEDYGKVTIRVEY